jgi:hypothetical protein
MLHEFVGDARPVDAIRAVTGFVDPEWLFEIEADASIDGWGGSAPPSGRIRAAASIAGQASRLRPIVDRDAGTFSAASADPREDRKARGGR